MFAYDQSTYAAHPQNMMENSNIHFPMEIRAFDCSLSNPKPVTKVGAYESKPDVVAKPVIVNPICGSNRQLVNCDFIWKSV